VAEEDTVEISRKGLIRRARKGFRGCIDILPDDAKVFGGKTVYAYECLPHIKIDRRWFRYFSATPVYENQHVIGQKMPKRLLMHVRHSWIFDELEPPSDSGTHFLDNPDNYEFFLKYRNRAVQA
jgi:hypothetical protein